MVKYSDYTMWEGFFMSNTKNKWSIAEVKTSYFIFFGATIGAIVGLVTYVNNWL